MTFKQFIFSSVILTVGLVLAGCGGSSSGSSSSSNSAANPQEAKIYNFPTYNEDKLAVLVDEEFYFYVKSSSLEEFNANTRVKITFSKEGDRIKLSASNGFYMYNDAPASGSYLIGEKYTFTFHEDLASNDPRAHGTLNKRFHFVITLPAQTAGWPSASFENKGGMSGALPQALFITEKVGSNDYYGTSAPANLSDLIGTYQTEEKTSTIGGYKSYQSYAMKAVVESNKITYVIKSNSTLDCTVRTLVWDGNGDSIEYTAANKYKLTLTEQGSDSDYMNEKFGLEVTDGKVTRLINMWGSYDGGLTYSANTDTVTKADVGCE
ncbi:MAG: hypothetical protein WAO12_02435 [Venatoribacter sp.]